MVRQRRIYYNNAVYHITFRGNNRQAVLKEKEDKILLLKTLAKFKERFQFKLYGLCLMDNHAHLVIEASHSATVSRIMQAVLLSFSFQYRRKYKYIGHVWQGRFRSNVIEGDNYILECLEYIHNNPVRANMVRVAEDYPWSSFCLYQGTINAIIDKEIKLDRYGDTSYGTD